MPYKDGVFQEPDNGDRAWWARCAVESYAAETRTDPREQIINVDDFDADEKEHAEEVISDLLGDLQHLCRTLGIDFDEMLERGREHFAYEADEEEETADAEAS